MAGESELRFDGAELPPTSVRGVTESLGPIDNTQFDKYRLTIQFSDKNAPALDALRPGNWRRTVNGGLVDLSGNGSVVVVDCITELAGKLVGSPPSFTPSRTIVSGSGRTVDGFYYYRPQLTVGFMGWSMDTDEYGAAVSASAEFEEI